MPRSKEFISNIGNHNHVLGSKNDAPAMYYYGTYYGPKGLFQSLYFRNHFSLTQYDDKRKLLEKTDEFIAVYKTHSNSPLTIEKDLKEEEGLYKRGMKIKILEKIMTFDTDLSINIITEKSKNNFAFLVHHVEEVELTKIYHNGQNVQYKDSPPTVKDPAKASGLRDVCLDQLHELFERGANPSRMKEFYGIEDHETFLNSLVMYMILSGMVEDRVSNLYKFYREEYYEKSRIEERYEFANAQLRNVLYESSKGITIPLSSPRKIDNRDISEDAGSRYRNIIRNIPNLNKKTLGELSKKIEYFEKLEESTTKAIIEEYLDVISDLPWNKFSELNHDLKTIRSAINEQTYGLNKAKEKVMQYMAANLSKKDNTKGSILCLVGPPGVGKTFFAQSLGKALNRSVESIPLGGIDDVTILRGQRKGWVGAEPGQIIKALIRADNMNPIIIFDEIDKIEGWRGAQVQAALLEILDTNQNKQYKDAFIDFPVDISNSLFITTANSIGKLPAALKDRLDVVELSGYTLGEKEKIMKGYLIPKILRQLGLDGQEFSITDEAIKILLENTKFEPGMRLIERHINNLAMKYLVKSYEDGAKSIVINANNLDEMLDLRVQEKFNPDREAVGEISIMWVTSAGDAFGEIGGRGTVQARAVRGDGESVLTGSIQDIFKESISVARGFLESNSKKYGFNEDYFEKHDILIHVPETSVKKDGPSAGAAVTACLYSVIMQKKISQNIAITGEIDLAGNILPVGGIKEKISGAAQDGISHFIIPKANKKDYEKMMEKSPVENIEVLFAATFDEVLNIIFPDEVNTN